MKEEVKMFTVKCDNCGTLFQDDHMGYSCWGTFGDAWENASESGWVHSDTDYDVHYCPDCVSIDGNDNQVINKDRTKVIKALQRSPLQEKEETYPEAFLFWLCFTQEYFEKTYGRMDDDKLYDTRTGDTVEDEDIVYYTLPELFTYWKDNVLTQK